jgi:hypothetical protein
MFSLFYLDRFEIHNALHVDILWHKQFLNIISALLCVKMPYEDLEMEKKAKEKKGKDEKLQQRRREMRKEGGDETVLASTNFMIEKGVIGKEE